MLVNFANYERYVNLKCLCSFFLMNHLLLPLIMLFFWTIWPGWEEGIVLQWIVISGRISPEHSTGELPGHLELQSVECHHQAINTQFCSLPNVGNWSTLSLSMSRNLIWEKKIVKQVFITNTENRVIHYRNSCPTSYILPQNSQKTMFSVPQKKSRRTGPYSSNLADKEQAKRYK